MRKLISKVEDIADRSRASLIGEVKTALEESLPDHISLETNDDSIEIKGPGLSQQLTDNSSIRDVAFLMRGVR